ncbi:hypothetical protein OG799_08715 [Micromonospora sp. NBC_00898]|uniref:hypothetical protein n=1 Tax=Micromonospora sp. NBC_00898 TaxID=2975981 RepID=UPI00386D4D65|nr:hypothetical protein OG799_08715 [Micromonospora sp. NBC_00898]
MSPKVSIVATDSHRDPGPRPGADVTFLPLADDDGIPVYDESTPDLIQELQAAGAAVDTWHPARECEFVSSRGLVTDALLQIGVGIGSSAGWYALQTLLRRRGGQVRVVAIFDDGVQRRRAEVTGEAADVVEALEKLDPFSSEPS